MSLILNSIQSIHSEHIVLQILLYPNRDHLRHFSMNRGVNSTANDDIRWMYNTRQYGKIRNTVVLFSKTTCVSPYFSKSRNQKVHIKKFFGVSSFFSCSCIILIDSVINKRINICLHFLPYSDYCSFYFHLNLSKSIPSLGKDLFLPYYYNWILLEINTLYIIIEDLHIHEH